MDEVNQASFMMGLRRGSPLVFSAAFFGLIFGFTGASGGLPLFWVSAMSYVIFAGSAQFITLVLIVDNEELVAIIIVATILNLRHLLYGAVLHDLLTFSGIKKLLPAYFLTDESFLVTILVNKEHPHLRSDLVLLGAGVTLWFFWNLTTILGYFLFKLGEGFLLLPDNFVIAASFVGFLLEHSLKYPEDRGILIVSTVITLFLGWFTSNSILLIVVMIAGALYAILRQFLEERK